MSTLTYQGAYPVVTVSGTRFKRGEAVEVTEELKSSLLGNQSKLPPGTKPDFVATVAKKLKPSVETTV